MSLLKAKQLTDNQLAQFYIGLLEDYRQMDRNLSNEEVYQRLANNLHYSLNQSSKSRLSDLPPLEQQKLYTVLNTFFLASPRAQGISYPPPYFVWYFIPATTYSHGHHHCYCLANDWFFTWYMLNTLSSPHRIGHGHTTTNSNDDSCIKFIGVLLAFLVLILTGFALYYLFHQTMNSLERFIYNEGWLQGAITISSILASGAAVGVLTTFFLANPLALLIVSTGLVANPIGLTIAAIVCLSIMAAALGSWVTNQVQNWAIKKYHHDALDPGDPYRFSLTANQELNLRDHGLDPLKVKCAITALRYQIGTAGVSNYVGRLFSDKNDLVILRQLKNGELKEVKIGEFKFNLEFTPPYAPTSASYNASFYDAPPPPYPGSSKVPPAYNPEATSVPRPHPHGFAYY